MVFRMTLDCATPDFMVKPKADVLAAEIIDRLNDGTARIHEGCDESNLGEYWIAEYPSGDVLATIVDQHIVYSRYRLWDHPADSEGDAQYEKDARYAEENEDEDQPEVLGFDEVGNPIFMDDD